MAEVHIDRRSAPGPSVSSSDVLDAALTLFAERGYHGTSLKQVADRLHIRTPSLYNHMDSKASLLQRIVFGTLDQIDIDLAASNDLAATPRVRLRNCVEAYAHRHAVHRREALVVNQDTANLDGADLARAQELQRRHERTFRQIIEDGKKSGEFHVEHPRLASFAILEMCVSIARWFNDEGELSADQVATEYGILALNLVGASSDLR
ncbi:TetR/AcrR family transcriptional regulator [Paeniglutamicibacter sp. ZC-3]|uniref:TetR/AcrR family transcriptional regulator n=1 Tax=Paeniglutamicibacter sp. ZC-3 TaxID=2986919 RepID=UPI0021F71E94|nr:TetR/AcrR family transcriptional regulator [Paeniglutamicibacter sp. ZC-3]MCV9994309.1 TetR/AcrR family transcriptional regulator [Paeniglutamicibacter sp. ZC-3]